MRNGDVYRMEGMLKNGLTMDDIYHAFRNKYPPEEIDRFVKPKRKRRTKAEMEAARNDE